MARHRRLHAREHRQDTDVDRLDRLTALPHRTCLAAPLVLLALQVLECVRTEAGPITCNAMLRK